MEAWKGGSVECWLSEAGFSGWEDGKIGWVEGGTVGCLKWDFCDSMIYRILGFAGLEEQRGATRAAPTRR